MPLDLITAQQNSSQFTKIAFPATHSLPRAKVVCHLEKEQATRPLYLEAGVQWVFQKTGLKHLHFLLLYRAAPSMYLTYLQQQTKMAAVHREKVQNKHPMLFSCLNISVSESIAISEADVQSFPHTILPGYIKPRQLLSQQPKITNCA